MVPGKEIWTQKTVTQTSISPCLGTQASNTDYRDNLRQEIRWMASDQLLEMFSNLSILFCHHPLNLLQLLLLLQRGKSELEIFMKEEMVTETEIGDDQEGGCASRGAEVFQLGETGVGMTREGSLVLIIFFGK